MYNSYSAECVKPDNEQIYNIVDTINKVINNHKKLANILN